jgi:hypothetical protein
MVFANIRAQVVFPTPRGPQNKKACASCPFFMAFFRVVVICDCPTTVEKSWGLYFRAETINLSIIKLLWQTYSKYQSRQCPLFLSLKKKPGKFGIFTLLSIFALLITWEYRNEKKSRSWRSGN